MVWHEVDHKLNYLPIEEALNLEVRLSDFGSGVEAIRFIYIEVQPDNEINEDQVIYDNYAKEVTLALKLDYPKLALADPSGVKAMLCDLDLTGIQMIKGELKDKEFDIDRLHLPIKTLLTIKG